MPGGQGFIAVQCAQCSTMQVKQQPRQQTKKSRRGGGYAVSKWTCAVCNLRQSVVRVFACGSMARDIRVFVQEFNVTRGFATEAVAAAASFSLTDAEGQKEPDGREEQHPRCYVAIDAEVSTGFRRKRTDWSEYLENISTPADVEGGDEGLIVPGEGDEFVVVTELPVPEVSPNLRIGNRNEVSRPLKMKQRYELDHQQDVCRSTPSSLAERKKSIGRVQKSHPDDTAAVDGDPRRSECFALAPRPAAEGKGLQSVFGDITSSNFCNRSAPYSPCSAERFSSIGGGGPDKSAADAKIAKVSTVASKWSAYLHDEGHKEGLAGNNGDLPLMCSRSFSYGPESYDLLPGSSEDVAVDEEIHPDFL